MKADEWSKRAAAALQKYKYVLLVALAGVILLAWPSGGEEKEILSPPAAAASGDVFRPAGLEERLEQALSQVEGVGKVSVVLTLKETPRQVVAQDGEAAEGGGQTSRELTTVLASGGAGVQQPVLLQQLSPAYQGALVVAQGGDDPQVRLAVSQAVSALTGLGTDKISICTGK